MNPFILTWLFAIAAAPKIHSFELPATIDDALSSDEEVWLLTRQNARQPRSLYQLPTSGVPNKAAFPPNRAIGVDICKNPQGEWIPIYIGAAGIISAQGDPLLPGRFLFPYVDPAGLMAVPSCDAAGDTWLLFTDDGLRVRHPNGVVQDVELTPDVRAYSGATQEGLRSQPAFGAALSIYLPRFSFQTKQKEKGSTGPLVVQKQNSIHLYARDASGMFSTKAMALDFQQDLQIPRDMSPHPIWVDLDGDNSAELVVALTKGLSTENTQIFGWTVSPQSGRIEEKLRMQMEGFWLPLSGVDRPAGEGLLFAEVNLGLGAIASALLTGEIPLHTWILPQPGAKPYRTHTFHPQIQLRGERRIGSRPIATLDLDGDGWTDLIDLSDDQNLVWHRGERNGFADAPTGRIQVKPFTRHIVLSRANSLLLLADNESGGSVGTWIQGALSKNKRVSREGDRWEDAKAENGRAVSQPIQR